MQHGSIKRETFHSVYSQYMLHTNGAQLFYLLQSLHSLLRWPHQYDARDCVSWW